METTTLTSGTATIPLATEGLAIEAENKLIECPNNCGAQINALASQCWNCDFVLDELE